MNKQVKGGHLVMANLFFLFAKNMCGFINAISLIEPIRARCLASIYAALSIREALRE